MKVFGGIEVGGTKIVCVIASGPDDIHDEVVVSTTTPEETLPRVLDFFSSGVPGALLSAVGIGTFGPLDLNPSSSTYGYITSTTKPGWSQVDIAGEVQRALGVPVVLDTDVKAAAVGEGTWGAAKGLDDFIYLTIGTGIGGGGVFGGKPMHGMIHPEMGHIRIPHDIKKDPYKGYCPFHGDCFEGLASGQAMQERWGQKAEMLPPDHEAWELETHYIALALQSYICTLSPRLIILGGGVMRQSHLFPLIRAKVRLFLGGYVRSPLVLDDTEEYILPPALGNRAGVLGALSLALTRST